MHPIDLYLVVDMTLVIIMNRVRLEKQDVCGVRCIVGQKRALIGRHSAASIGPAAVVSASFWSDTNFFCFTIMAPFLGTVLATEPALLNWLCFIGYLCSALHIIGAYSAKMDMTTPALWCKFDALCRSYVPLVRSSTFSDIVF